MLRRTSLIALIVAALGLPVIVWVAMTHASRGQVAAPEARLPSGQAALAPPAAPARGALARNTLRPNTAALPLFFEANAGQSDPRVRYLSRAGGYMLFLTPREAVFAMRP